VRWQLRDAEPRDIERLTRDAGLSPVIARLLVARGITTPEQAKEFLAPSLSYLHSPYLMAGLRTAV
jgi:single-stranded-DNA-specific exonuclease